MKKVYSTTDNLFKLSKKSRSKWRSILLVTTLILIANLAIGYFIVAGPSSKLASGLGLSVVKIYSGEGVGTGFFVSERFVLTAAHVGGEVGTQLYIENADGNQLDGEVVASGFSHWRQFLVDDGLVMEGATPHDWALVEIASPLEKQTVLYLGAEEDAFQGGTVYLAGHPEDQPLTVTKGIISRIDPQAIRTDGEIDSGFSGGPMLLVEGDEYPESGIVVGIVVSSPKLLTSVKTAVPIDLVSQKCSEAGYELY